MFVSTKYLLIYSSTSLSGQLHGVALSCGLSGCSVNVKFNERVDFICFT